MIRNLKLVAALGMVLAPLVPAMAEQSANADMQAKFQQEAEKSCNYDLDHDHFESYGTMDECISDKSAKLMHAYNSGSLTAQAKSSAPHRPN